MCQPIQWNQIEHTLLNLTFSFSPVYFIIQQYEQTVRTCIYVEDGIHVHSELHDTTTNTLLYTIVCNSKHVI